MQENKKHTQGFNIPEGYLDNFEERLLEKMEQDILPESNGFKVPETYFDAINGARITAKISENNANVIPLKRMAIIGLSIAACFAILFTITNNTTTTSLDTIAMTSIEDYISSDNISISMEDISAEISEDDMEALEEEDVLFQEAMLEEYLLDTIDTYTIINE